MQGGEGKDQTGLPGSSLLCTESQMITMKRGPLEAENSLLKKTWTLLPCCVQMEDIYIYIFFGCQYYMQIQTLSYTLIWTDQLVNTSPYSLLSLTKTCKWLVFRNMVLQCLWVEGRERSACWSAFTLDDLSSSPRHLIHSLQDSKILAFISTARRKSEYLGIQSILFSITYDHQCSNNMMFC